MSDRFSRRWFIHAFVVTGSALGLAGCTDFDGSGDKEDDNADDTGNSDTGDDNADDTGGDDDTDDNGTGDDVEDTDDDDDN